MAQQLTSNILVTVEEESNSPAYDRDLFNLWITRTCSIRFCRLTMGLTNCLGDGCTTRQSVLIRDAEESVIYILVYMSGMAHLLLIYREPPTTGDCTVTSGDWISAYDDVPASDAQDLDIDHIVPLKEVCL